MSERSDTDAAASSGQPDQPSGKRRTWWHPLLVDLFKWVLHTAYEVWDEVPVGTMPLRLDIVLIRRLRGRLPKSAARDLAALLPRLNRFTLVEFKGPTDALIRGDLDSLLGHAHLYRAQARRPIDRGDLSLIIIAPRLNRAFQSDLRRSGCTWHEEEPGIHRIEGLMFSAWIVETAVAVGAAHPMLSIASPVFLEDPKRIIDELSTHGYGNVLEHIVQRIEQFKAAGESFAMQHANTKQMEESFEQLRNRLVKEAPLAVRLEGLSPEERIEGLSPEDLVGRLTPEERIEGLSTTEMEQLIKLLERRSTQRSGKKPATKRRKKS